MSNFSSAPKRHVPSAGQMAVAAALIQQRQQVGLSRQQVGLQKESLDAQNQANSLAAAQLSEMQKIEENRKREKLLDVWSAEFQHRGMSPLESHTQSHAEMEIMDLIVDFTNLSASLERKKNAALGLVKKKSVRKVPRRIKQTFLYSFGSASTLAACSGLISGVSQSSSIPNILQSLGVAIMYVAFFSAIAALFFFLVKPGGKLPLTEEEETLALSPVYAWFTKKVEEIKNSLDLLPPSQLSDDSSFRDMLKSLVS